MTKTAKTITYAAGIFTAFWLIIAFLITSVEAIAYWTPVKSSPSKWAAMVVGS